MFCFLLAVYQSTEIDVSNMKYDRGKLAFFPQTEIGISFRFQVRWWWWWWWYDNNNNSVEALVSDHLGNIRKSGCN